MEGTIAMKKITWQLFEKIIYNLDKKKYHISRELDENRYIRAWSIYRQDIPVEEYFSPNNKPILNSTDNDIFDLIDFVKEQKDV